MWKRFYLILFLFFGFVLSSTLFLNQHQASAHSVDKPPVFSESDKQSVVRKYREALYYEPDFLKNANIFYFVYKTADSYGKDNPVKVVMYTCVNSFQNPDNGYQPEEKYLENCGSYLKYDKESGIYSIDIHAVYVSTGTYYRSTNQFTFSSFEKQSQYNDFKKIISSSDDPDFYTIYLDQHNKINQFNIRPQSNFEQPGSGSGGIAGLDFGAFAKGIVNGITDFFKPLVDLINQTFKIITDSITGFFQKLSEFVKNLLTVDFSIIDKKSKELQSTIKNSGSIGKLIFLPLSILSVFMNQTSVSCSNFSVFIAKDYLPVKYDLCSVPDSLLLLARSVLLVSIVLILVNRIIVFVNVLFGNKYSWESKGEDS